MIKKTALLEFLYYFQNKNFNILEKVYHFAKKEYLFALGKMNHFLIKKKALQLFLLFLKLDFLIL